MHTATSLSLDNLSISAGYTVETAKDIDQVLALRQDWQRLCRYPDSDIDFFLTVAETERTADRPHVICVRRDGSVKAILVARIGKLPLQLTLGYKKLSSPPLRFLKTAHGGLLGEDSEEIAVLLMNSVCDALRRGEADVAWFHGIDTNTAFHRVADRTGGLFTRDPHPSALQRWRVKLPSSYEDFVRGRSSNTRHNVKRYTKRFRDAFGEQSTIKTFRQPNEVDTMLADTEAVARKTYHRGLGVGFFNNEQTRAISLLSARQGWLRAYVLYVKGEPCAFWNGWLYGRTFFAWTTGFDPGLNDSRPGLFLLQHMFRDLCAENVEEVDFGFGDAQYKRDWCDYECTQMSRLLFAPTAKGISVNLLRSPIIALSNAGQNILGRTAVLQRLKKAWRDRLARKPR